MHLKRILLCLLAILYLPNIVYSNPLDYWHWRNPLPQANTLRASAYGNGMFVAVGYYGTVVISNNGTDWTYINTGTTKSLYGVTYGQGMFVVVGEEGTVIHSRDGRNWTVLNVGVEENLFAVSYGGGRFVAVGQRGIIINSADGQRWTVVSGVTNLNINSICFDLSNFYAVGSELSFFDTKYILLRSGNGADWQIVSEGEEFSLFSISCVNNKIVGVGTTIDIDDYGLFHQIIAYSDDNGLTFNMQKFERGALYAISNLRGLYIAVGNAGNILKSIDGLNWDYQTPVINDILFSVTSSDTVSVAVGGRGKIIKSLNGSNWQEVSSGINDPVSDIAYCNKRLLAVSQYGSIIGSRNGIDWQLVRSGDGISLNRIICTQDGYIAVGNRGLILTSTDGNNWVRRDSTTDDHLLGVIYENNRYIVVGGGKMIPDFPTNIILTSEDGITWNKVLSEISFPIRSVAYGNGFYLAIAESRYVYRSYDGNNWNRLSQYQFALRDITFTGQGFLAVGGEFDWISDMYKGVIVSSTNGSDWDKMTIPDSDMLYRVECLHYLCASVGGQGTILTSDGTSTWQRRLFKKTETLYGLEHYNNSVLVSGSLGAILQSNTVLNDVPEDRWSYVHIDRLFKHSITYGCELFKFCPERLTTRGEAVAFIIRAKFGEDFAYPQGQYFADVPEGHVFFKYIQKAKLEGITKAEGMFYVDSLLTRAEMSALLIRSLYGEDFTYPQSPYFVDVPQTAPFFKYIQKMKQEGLTTVSNLFNPNDYLSREQAAAFVSRGYRLSE